MFLRTSELPGLLIGVPRGDPVALRRVMGARRAGRVALLLGLAGLALGAPLELWLALAAGQIVIAWPGARISRPRLSWLEYQRVSLWLGGSALIALAPVRALVPLPDCATYCTSNPGNRFY